MEPCFNELSQKPFCNLDAGCDERVHQYAELIAELRTSYGVTHIRYEKGLYDIKLKSDTSLGEYCLKNRHDKEVLLILATQRKPYIEDGKEEEIGFYEVDDVKCIHGEEELDSIGAYCAYLYNTITVSFASDDVWKQSTLELVLYTKSANNSSQYNKRIVSVVNISDKLQLEDDAFTLWAFDNKYISLPKSEKEINEKTFKARDDHGKDVLKDFFDKIKKETFVEGMVNSLPFNPKFEGFIKNVYPNGNIEIVLHWTDKGLGMLISTTAKNLAQTKLAARLLKEKYDK